MAYLGTPIDTRNQFQSLVGKRFNGDGSTTDFTLDVAPGSVLDIEVFVGNVRQDPNSAYTLSGTTLSFTGAPPSGTNNIYVVHQAKSVGTIDVPALGVSTASIQADAITEAKIADDAVESEHLNNNIISGQTELAATPADTDELLISDAGTIKRIDFSHIKSANTPMFYGSKNGDQNLSRSTATKITGLTTNEVDTDSAFDGTTFTVPSGGAGKYVFHGAIHGNFANVGNDGEAAFAQIYVGGSQKAKGGLEFDSGGEFHQMLVNTSVAIDLSEGNTVELYGTLTDDDASSGNAFVNAGDATYLFGFRIAE
jgi:hypothetical protein